MKFVAVISRPECDAIVACELRQGSMVYGYCVTIGRYLNNRRPGITDFFPPAFDSVVRADKTDNPELCAPAPLRENCQRKKESRAGAPWRGGENICLPALLLRGFGRDGVAGDSVEDVFAVGRQCRVGNLEAVAEEEAELAFRQSAERGTDPGNVTEFVVGKG